MKVYTKTVSQVLLNLLEELSEIESLSAFSLGDGTSLALQFGHRKSIDIDLFSHQPFDSLIIQNEISTVFTEAQLLNRTSGSLCFVIDGVKIDILFHAYPILAESEKKISFPCVSIPDMAAMKVNAVTNRGSKKDFSDLLLLYEQGLSLEKSLEYFCQKYGDAGRFLAIRSLNWFDDAEQEPDPQYLNGWTWHHVRDRISELAGKLLSG